MWIVRGGLWYIKYLKTTDISCHLGTQRRLPPYDKLPFGDHLSSLCQLLLSTHSLDPCLWGESDHPMLRMWVQLKRWCASGVWVLQRGHSGDGCVLASTLCKYDFRKGYLFVLSWARVRRVMRGSIFSELLMCGGGACSILLLPLVPRYLETIDVCIWHMFDFMSVLGSVGMFVV